MIRYLATLALGFTLVSGATLAADLGAPPSMLAPQLGAERPAIWTGCYASGSVNGTFLRDGATSQAITSGGAAAGCDLQKGVVVVGAYAGIDLGHDDFRAATASVRIGATVNPHVLVYGLVGATTPLDKMDLANAVITVGGGLETWIGRHLSVFAEGARDVKSFGTLSTTDDFWTVRGGVRWRF